LTRTQGLLTALLLAGIAAIGLQPVAIAQSESATAKAKSTTKRAR